jgi:uncharacterized protein (TIGR02265 family)
METSVLRLDDMAFGAHGRRQVKGVNLIELVKVLKIHRRDSPLDGLSSEAIALLDQRILPTEWYPLEALHEYLNFTFENVIMRNEAQVTRLGEVGAQLALTTVHRAYVRRGDPQRTAQAMVRLWSMYFDFGELVVEAEGERAARFTMRDYPDVPLVHGLMIAAWHAMSATLAGGRNVRCQWLERPWLGSQDMVYLVQF